MGRTAQTITTLSSDEVVISPSNTPIETEEDKKASEKDGFEDHKNYDVEFITDKNGLIKGTVESVSGNVARELIKKKVAKLK